MRIIDSSLRLRVKLFLPRHQNFLSTRARAFPPAALLMYISLLSSTRRGSEPRLHSGLKRQSGAGALPLAGGVGPRQESDDEQMRQQSLLVCLGGASPQPRPSLRFPGKGRSGGGAAKVFGMSQTQRRMEPQVEVIISRARSWLQEPGPPCASGPSAYLGFLSGATWSCCCFPS